MRTWWNGRWYYLGSADGDGWRAEYLRLCKHWDSDPYGSPTALHDLSVVELCRDYLASDAVGSVNNRKRVRWAVKILCETHGTQYVSQFGPRALSVCQSDLGHQTIGEGANKRARYSRTTISKWTEIIRRIWRWAVETERIPVELYQALMTVRGPRPTEGRAPKSVKPAPIKHIRAILPFLSRTVRAMVELQLLTGMRPGELFRLTPGQVHRTGKVDVPDVGEIDLRVNRVWVYLPHHHKTATRGKSRWVVFGPRAQKVLRPFLDRPKDATCFDPREPSRENYDKHRKPGGKADRKGTVPTSGRATSRYTRQTYYNAVVRACERAEIPTFSPYQIRHRTLTDVDSVYGLDAAQAAGGHSSPQTTRRYAKRSFSRAVEVARAVG